jgi:hypothetical protein
VELNEIKFQDAATRAYLGSPSILRLPDGALLATHDYFGNGAPRTPENEWGLTSVYRSEDNGGTWVEVNHIMGCFWGNLFWHAGAVYLLSISQEYGSVVIRRSDDGGLSWTHPRDGSTGVLFRGGPFRQGPNYHCAPMPMLYSGGRIYRAVEDNDPCSWPEGFKSCVISAPQDSDLLDADSWTMSNKLAYDPAWTPKEWGPVPKPGWLEGNVVEAPDGELLNILRFNSTPVADKAAVVHVHDQGARLTFDPARDFIDFPGGMTKFSIRRDPQTGLYWTLANNNTDPAHAGQRNVLSVFASRDLRDWRHLQTLLEDDSGLSWEDSIRYTGFQYVDWQFDGDDIIYMVRMAYKGAHNFHDANRMTFHVIRGFRALAGGI